MLRRSTTSLQISMQLKNMNLFGRSRLPGDGTATNSKQEMDRIRYFETKSRSQWDYQGIDERITMASQFNDRQQRPTFDGPRPDNECCFNATLSSWNPKFKKLHEYFDEYTKPGTDRKVAAAMAVKEQWDSAETYNSSGFYYPGETWKRNRPSFRSVPAELLNSQTWYHWIDLAYNLNELATTYRDRKFNPQWPPPGYQLPAFNVAGNRQFIFGADEPSLISEIERWFWFRNWFENNMRQGPWEYLGYFCFCFVFWCITRSQGSNTRFRAMLHNVYYPGRSLVRAFGEPKDWATEKWWWQEDLVTWPNQGEIWYLGEIRWKYINLVKKNNAEGALREELLGVGTGSPSMRNGFNGEEFWANKHRGNHGHWYWWRTDYMGYGMGFGGTNVGRKAIGEGRNFDYAAKVPFQYEEDSAVEARREKEARGY